MRPNEMTRVQRAQKGVGTPAVQIGPYVARNRILRAAILALVHDDRTSYTCGEAIVPDHAYHGKGSSLVRSLEWTTTLACMHSTALQCAQLISLHFVSPGQHPSDLDTRSEKARDFFCV